MRAVVEDVEGEHVRLGDERVRVGHGAEEIVDVEQAIRAPRALDQHASGNLARARAKRRHHLLSRGRGNGGGVLLHQGTRAGGAGRWRRGRRV